MKTATKPRKRSVFKNPQTQPQPKTPVLDMKKYPSPERLFPHGETEPFLGTYAAALNISQEQMARKTGISKQRLYALAFNQEAATQDELKHMTVFLTDKYNQLHYIISEPINTMLASVFSVPF